MSFRTQCSSGLESSISWSKYFICTPRRHYNIAPLLCDKWIQWIILTNNLNIRNIWRIGQIPQRILPPVWSEMKFFWHRWWWWWWWWWWRWLWWWGWGGWGWHWRRSNNGLIVGGAWGLEPTGHLFRAAPMECPRCQRQRQLLWQLHEYTNTRLDKYATLATIFVRNFPGGSSSPLEIAIEKKKKISSRSYLETCICSSSISLKCPWCY